MQWEKSCWFLRIETVSPEVYVFTLSFYDHEKSFVLGSDHYLFVFIGRIGILIPQ